MVFPKLYTIKHKLCTIFNKKLKLYTKFPKITLCEFLKIDTPEDCTRLARLYLALNDQIKAKELPLNR